MEQSMHRELLLDVAEIQLSYKSTVRAAERPTVKCPEKAYEIFLQHWDFARIDFVEQFKILLLNRANRALGICEISTGGVSGTVVDQKLIFSAALKANASFIILAHNHPSGNIIPSEADKQTTYKICQAAKVLDIPVIDHLVITRDAFYSFADNGLILQL